MRHVLSLRNCLAFVLLQQLFIFTAFAAPVPTGPKADWITEKTINLNAQVPADDIQDGIYYLILDWQTKVTQDNQKSGFRRYATKAVNPKGVEDVSQINISYDPNYESVKLHRLIVWRDGQAIDKLGSARFSVLQQEKELDNLIYNGDETINILIDDVRIGDVVEYSYTMDGYNPIFADGFSLSHSLNWSVPIEHQYIKVLWQKDRPLFHTIKNSDIQLQQKQLAEGIEYSLEQQPALPSSQQSNAPHWFSAYASVRFTDVKDWAQVVQWGSGLFTDAFDSSPQIKALAQKLKSQSDSPSQHIADILQYVQSQVRYLGIEFGINSHKPSNALETLERHYGDCKDKVTLLISLLNEIGVRAYPALVNTDFKYGIKDRAPRYTMFDHVIAVVEFDGRQYWLDPTRTYQAGDLKDIHQPDYGYALVLDGKGKALTKVEIEQGRSQIIINERFDMTDDNSLSADHHIETTYTRRESDTIRARLASKGLSKLQKEYLEFYQNYYEQITAISPAQFEDDRSSNTVVSKEHYSIENMWEANEKKQMYYANFYANLLSPAIETPEDVTREHPLAVDNTLDLTQTITINLGSLDWHFSEKTIETDNQFFYYKRQVSFNDKNNQLVLNYQFYSKTDAIAPQDYGEYLKAIKEVDNDLSYRIRKTMNASSSDKDQVSEQITWGQWLIAGLLAWAGLVILTVALYRERIRVSGDAHSSVFYPVSLYKLSLCWLLSFGIYGIFWFYKNWQYVKANEESARYSMPWARALFSVFWYFPLYLAIERHSMTERQTPGFKRPMAIIAAIIYLVAGLSTNYLPYFILSTVISLLLVLPLAHSINQLNGQHSDPWIYNSKWHATSFLTLILCSPIFAYNLAYDIKLIPTTEVIKGEQMLGFNIKYLQRKKVIEPGDKIELFYSSAFLNLREDGNGFTKRHVFSYWDDDGTLSVETADYQDIKDIKVTWSGSYLDNTVISIERHDETNFLLYVDNEGEQDKHFVKQLKQLWQAHKK